LQSHTLERLRSAIHPPGRSLLKAGANYSYLNRAMAFYQTCRRLALLPAGSAAAAASTSFLLGRYTSSTTNQKMNQVATQRLTSFAIKPFAKPSSSHRPLSSSAPREVAKDAGGATGTAITAEGSKGFVQWYEGHLHSRPVTTKAITGSILWGLGDFVAQVVPAIFAKDGVDDSTTGAVIDKEFSYDAPRTAKAVFYGFVIHAPLSHLHYNFLEWMTVKAGLQGLTITVFKTVMEQFVYWSWFSNSLYHGAMGLMNGMNMTQIYDRIADVLMPTQYAQWTFVSRNAVNDNSFICRCLCNQQSSPRIILRLQWIPVQLLNFRFVPVRHQLNVVLLTSVVWTALLSAWYPPKEKKVGDEEK
ncbi:hypothetical protein ACHAXA_001649, partial [Cyclostephanos tholiformis]